MDRQRTIFDSIYDFLASVKLALVLLISLAVTSIAGTVIPQNLPHQEYLQRYGQELYTFLYYLDLFDMYRSWWFVLLLALLLANLIACSIKRLPATIKLAQPLSGERLGPGFFEKQRFYGEVRSDYFEGDGLNEIEAIFSRSFKKPRRVDSDWGTLLLASKGAFSRYGVYVIHTSLVFVVVGALLGNFYGFRAFMTLTEGLTASQAETDNAERITLPFQVRLDRFKVRFYPTGMPSEYRSDLTVIEEGREVRQGTVRVNHPLKYGGITFYQHSWGQSGVREMGLRLTRRSDGKVFELTVSPNRPNVLPDGAGTFLILDMSENYLGHGPAVKLLIRPESREAYALWVLSGPRPESGHGSFDFELTRFDVAYYTGLQVSKDPGVIFIWIGFGLILAGCLITFFFSHQKLYLGIIQEDGGMKIIAAGTAHRNRGSFEIKFNRLVGRLERAVSGEKS